MFQKEICSQSSWGIKLRKFSSLEMELHLFQIKHLYCWDFWAQEKLFPMWSVPDVLPGMFWAKKSELRRSWSAASHHGWEKGSRLVDLGVGKILCGAFSGSVRDHSCSVEQQALLRYCETGRLKGLLWQSFTDHRADKGRIMERRKGQVRLPKNIHPGPFLLIHTRFHLSPQMLVLTSSSGWALSQPPVYSLCFKTSEGPD